MTRPKIFSGEASDSPLSAAFVLVPVPRESEELHRRILRVESLHHTVESHGSEALVVSLGVNAAVDDPAAPLMISPAGFRAAGEKLADVDLPTVFVQEGGYDLARLVPLVLDVLTSFESGRR